MNKNKYVLVQFVEFLDCFKFRHIVAKYNGDKYGQLANRENLRDLIVAIDAHSSKYYHLEMGKNILKSSLVRANQDRDYPPSTSLERQYNDIFELGGNVYAFDSITIDLCLSVF